MQASTNKERLDRLKIATILLGGVAAFAAIAPTPAAAQACTDGAGAGSIQCGDFAQADESGSSAVGDGSSATGIFSTAIGSNTVASDTSATALGQNADATAQNATAVGRSSEASGTSSTAVGASSIASEQNSTSLGAAAEAGAPRSMALGALSTANATSSVAIGYASVADEESTVSVGSANFQRRITYVADGVNATDAATLGQVQTGLSSLGTFLQDQIDDNTTTLQSHAIAIGAASVQILDNAASIAANSAMLGDHETRLQTLEGLAFNLDNTLDRFDDEIDGSTAVAIAMSGNAFLPGKRFNMTGNVGTYNGAWAGALQIGALVKENIAINAGIATGLNKRGKTGARVGFSFGW